MNKVRDRERNRKTNRESERGFFMSMLQSQLVIFVL